MVTADKMYNTSLALFVIVIIILLVITKIFGFRLDLNLVTLRPGSNYRHQPFALNMAAVSVKNPFEVSVKNGTRSPDETSATPLWTHGVRLGIKCNRICKLECFWGVQLLRFLQEVQLIPKFGQEDISGARSQSETHDVMVIDLLHKLSCDVSAKQNLYPNDNECTDVQCKSSNESLIGNFFDERRTEIERLQIVPLVVALELQEEEQRDVVLNQDIICLVSAITFAITEAGRKIEWKIVYQCVQTADKKIFSLQKLYSSGVPSTEVSLDADQENTDNHGLCIICHTWPVTRCLIPCRHACLCGVCFERTRQCPVCRQLFSSYLLVNDESNMPLPLPSSDELQNDTSNRLSDMGLWELIKAIWNAS